jgi:ATP-dependent DNA helicase RecQ
MKKYTANYAYTNPNFVIQNLVETRGTAEQQPLFYVLKNILQRGFPTVLSAYLQEQLGAIHLADNFEERFLFASSICPQWQDTIKGDKENKYFPALTFFEHIIGSELGDYAFVQALIIPEIGINDLTGEWNHDFVNQQVDFYLPPAKLVIEIDGQQHKQDQITRVSDQTRDAYLKSRGITTIRITTRELQNGTYAAKLSAIREHLQRYERMLAMYRRAAHMHATGAIGKIERETKLLPTAIIRFQILLLELLIHKYLSLKDPWNFNILLCEDIDEFAELAIRDVQIWIGKLWRLKFKEDPTLPDFTVNISHAPENFRPSTNAINIDFSLAARYTDENRFNPDILYVRTDYFDLVKERNYFRVSTAAPINYKVTEADKNTLEFFLLNIFGKPSFREGQFPIIENALNRRDTIGLLPTGGGKSLCYQLPCLLQPAINFVVCPIKSLMYDQYENLNAMLITNVAHITSDKQVEERRGIEQDFENGRYLFVFLSPEKFQIPSFRDKIKSILANFDMAYAVIDEVHCLSEWGHDFRTSYLNLARTIEKLSPKDADGEGRIKYIGLTATASVNVLKDIKIEFSRQKQQLEDSNIKSLLDYSRKELNFEVREDQGNKNKELQELLGELADTGDLTETDEKAAIIFTPNVNGAFGCYTIANDLNTRYPQKVHWYSGDIPKVDEYDAKGTRTGRKIPVMNAEDFLVYKDSVQKNFKKNHFPVMVATKAFGMGIDKANIHYTVHYGLPSSVEALYQEAGRAGRWDKRDPEKADLMGRCFVLYSPETHDQDRVRRLFDKDTTFAEMKEISEEVGFKGRDIFKQVFLFIQGQNDIAEDLRILLAVVGHYYQPGARKQIFWDAARRDIGISPDILQKAIYRLSLLGIVSDWTTNFINHYEVEFKKYDDKSLVRQVAHYINKYEPDKDVQTAISLVSRSSVLERCAWYLLNWTFENIAHNRKQSLKTLMDWCDDFTDSEHFKRRIDNYFKFTETTFVLQHIAENPRDYLQWFTALNAVERDSKNAIISTIFLPDIQDFQLRVEKFEGLRDGISRFLESYANNPGLNFLSGFVRLFTSQYQDPDGGARLESAMAYILNQFDADTQTVILQRMLEAGRNLNETAKAEFCRSLLKFYPQKLVYIADFYNIAWLLNERYAEMISKIKRLNTILDEQLGQI